MAWTYPAGEGNYLFNPIVIDGVMYVQAKNNSLVALDALTGKELWTHPFQGPVVQRGINYWESKDRSDRRLLTINARIPHRHRRPHRPDHHQLRR